MATVTKIDRQTRWSEAEWETRVQLAACYRLVARYRMTDLIYTHISARVPGMEDQFLLNPYGLMFDEITASSLVKIDLEGRQIEDEPYGVNAAGFTIHSAVHAARPDVGCVIHLHTEAGMALSMLDCGLRPLSQTAMFLDGQIAFHDYEGVALDLGERERLVRDLGDKPAMILRNHGTLVAGRTIGHAYVTMFLLEKAARAQLQAMACNSRLVEAAPKAVGITAQFGKSGAGGTVEHAWRAMVRRLDREDTSYKN